jgi:hypothetical protein
MKTNLENCKTDDEISAVLSKWTGVPIDVRSKPLGEVRVGTTVRGIYEQLKHSDHVRVFGDNSMMKVIGSALEESGLRVSFVLMKYGTQLIVQRSDDGRAIDPESVPVEVKK